MAFTAQQVIDDARLRHAAFDPVAIPLPVALSLCNGVVSRLRGNLIAIDPSLLLEQNAAPLPLADFDEGVLLPPFVSVVEAFAVSTPDYSADQRGEPVAIINYQQRFDTTAWPAIFVVRDRVFLKGTPQEWTVYSSLVTAYIPAFTPMTLPSDQVPLPEQALLACTELVAAAFAIRRSTEIDPVAGGAIASVAAEQRQLFLDEMASQRRYERWSPREY